MIRSMTGFGEAELETPAGVLRAEIRTVNHRFFSVNLRLPTALDRYEPRLKEWLKAHFSRGHVNATYRLEGNDGVTGVGLGLDLDRARRYLAIFRQLRDELDLPGDVTLDLLAGQPDLVTREAAETIEVDGDAVREVTDRASRAVIDMREEEGRNLAVDLEDRLSAMALALKTIEERAPARLDTERERLRRSVAELAADVSLDEDRLAREIALIADRWDISREANTIGSKANDAGIEHRVVDIKNEIERLREQVENVE
jgi:uncharacterized protein (TIGR00255 family)